MTAIRGRGQRIRPIGDEKYKLIRGDSLTVLKNFTSNSVDALVTDPPSGISFMGKDWDHDKGGRDLWIAWMRDIMKEVHRVLKPGAHGLVWALPRVSHWTATALEDAGFEVRDKILHLQGQGFPKSLSVGKAIDKEAGAKRKVVEERTINCSTYAFSGSGVKQEHHKKKLGGANITAPSTPAAKQFEGWGTGLKPAVEEYILVRKKISEKTVAKNMIKWSTGALNIDKSRVGNGGHHGGEIAAGKSSSYFDAKNYKTQPNKIYNQGRFPSHLLLSHSSDCVQVGVKKVRASTLLTKHKLSESENIAMSGKNYARNPRQDYGTDGTETVAAWRCTEGCAVRLLDLQSGNCKSAGMYLGYKNSGPGIFGGGKTKEKNAFAGESGGASRFFYCSKPSRRERNLGCEGLTGRAMEIGDERPSGTSWERRGRKISEPRTNTHPCVKSTKLCSYLINLITPPEGVVLDPFLGSGSTGVSAIRDGFYFIGIEKDKEYLAIARRRISYARSGK